MLGQERERSLPFNLVAGIEIGDVHAVGQAEDVVQPLDLGVFVADPLVEAPRRPDVRVPPGTVGGRSAAAISA